MVLLLLFLVLSNLFLLVAGLIPIVMILLVIDLVLFLLLLRLASFVIKKTSRSKFRSAIDTARVTSKDPYFTVGILHPFCNSGGGGERVLWSAVKALQDKYPNCICVIYTGDRQATGDEMVRNACDRFQIKLNPDRTKFVYLRLRSLVLDKYYPMFTLLGQSLGSVVLGIECFLKFIPDVYMETTGYAFTYPLFHYLASTPVCCYTHYPTISTDMLELVANSRENFNNRSSISRSPTLTRVKLAYYHLFARLYSWCGRCADCVMVNSTWTQNHINQLWQLAYKTKIVYPPCDVKLFEPVFGDARHDQQFHIASVAQFRPEKNHSMQVRALAKFIQKLKENGVKAQELEKVKLVLIGSCRNEEDQQRVDGLKALAKSLSIENHCEFKVNFKFDLLLTNLAEAAVGIHSMIDEHFGIGVVECMAAGTCMIAHNSAGPKMDIVVPYRGKLTGYLADTDEQYAEHLYSIYTKSVSQRNEIRQAAREHVKRFSQENFDVDFVEAFDSLCFTKFIGKPTESRDKAE